MKMKRKMKRETKREMKKEMKRREIDGDEDSGGRKESLDQKEA